MVVEILRQTRKRERSIAPPTTTKKHFKEESATPSKRNEMGAYKAYVTISFFEDKEAIFPLKCFFYSLEP